MKIWHVGDFSDPYRVDGISSSGWLMACEQSRHGEDVSLVVDSAPSHRAFELAGSVGLEILRTRADIMRGRQDVCRLLDRDWPDVVHMHSVFIPRQAVIAKILRKRRIPYVVTPGGGLASEVLRRGAVKKGIYGTLVERPRLLGASAITMVAPTEEHAIRSYVSKFEGIVRCIPNPVSVGEPSTQVWRPPESCEDVKRISFLGRYDVLTKGIDIIVELARLLPEIQFDLYGTEDPKTRRWLARLKSKLPANVFFHAPVFGVRKSEVLMKSSLYLQPSRWDAFGVSVAEAMCLGVPCAISANVGLADVFKDRDLGLVLPSDVRNGAQEIREKMAQLSQLVRWSKRGREFALKHFDSALIAKKYISLYKEVAQTRCSAEVQRGLMGRTEHRRCRKMDKSKCS